MKNSKFNLVYEQCMKSIICETFQRFYITDIAYACSLVTNDFTEPYVKGETGRKVLSELQAHPFRFGGENHGPTKSTLFETPEEEAAYKKACDILETVYRYWSFKAEKDRSQFSVDCAHPFNEWKMAMTYNGGGYKVWWENIKISLITYAVCTAMTKKAEKIERNRETMATMNANDAYKPGEKVTVELTFEKYEYNDTYGNKSMRCVADDGLKFKIPVGTAISKIDFWHNKDGYGKKFNKPEYRKPGSASDIFIKGDRIKFTGTVKSVNVDWKLISLTRAVIDDVTHWEKPDDIKAAEKKAEDVANFTYKPTETDIQSYKTLAAAFLTMKDIDPDEHFAKPEVREPVIKLCAKYVTGSDDDAHVEIYKKMIDDKIASLREQSERFRKYSDDEIYFEAWSRLSNNL